VFGALAPAAATGPATITLDRTGEGRIKASPAAFGTLAPIGALGRSTADLDSRPAARVEGSPDTFGTLAPVGVLAPTTIIVTARGLGRAPDPVFDAALPGLVLAGATYWTLITDHYPRAQT